MMKVIVTHNSKSISFDIEKNLPEHEAFEVLRAFTVSAFEDLPDPLVFSLAGGAESFQMQDPKDWKEGIIKHFKSSVICLNVVEPQTESDGESDSYVVLTQDGSDQKTEVKKEESVEEPIADQKSEEEEEPVIEDAEEDLEDKPEGTQEPEEQSAEQQSAEQEETSPQSMKQRIMQFIVEIGSEAVQNIVAVAHSLITEGADLGDAIRTAIQTSEKAANHPLTQDLLAIMDVYVQKFQNQFNWQPILAQFNIDHIVALIPGIVDALTRSMEGAERVELDMSPLISQVCPMLRGMCQNMQAGQERVWHANPMNPFAVFEQARRHMAAEQEQREQQPQEAHNNQVVHRGVICDGCNMSPIVGVRYKSTLRADYDLCEECEKTHDPKDPLIKIKTPLDEMDVLPGLGEFRRAAVGRGHGRPWCSRGGRGRGRGCRRMRNFFQNMKKHCEENGSWKGCGSSKKDCDWKKNCDWKKKCEWKKNCWKNWCKPENMPEDRRDPGRETVESKKAELKSKKQEIKASKKEFKQLKKEMKKLKKEAKQSLKKEKYASEVVGHLDSEETSTQKPGSSILHQWKVKNTGTEAWNGDVLAIFKKGNHSLLAAGFEVLDVGEVQPGHVCYLPVMLDTPKLPGTYSAIFRMTNAKGRVFGEPLRVVIEVPEEEEEAPPTYEEVNEEAPKSSPWGAFSSVPGSNIPKTIDVAPVEEKVVEEEVKVVEEKEEPAIPFAYAVELQMLKDMGLGNDEEMMKSVLVAAQGNIAQAIETLFN